MTNMMRQVHADCCEARMARRKAQQDQELLSLNTVLQSLGHERVTVELVDDTVMYGTLEDADAAMKCACPTRLHIHSDAHSAAAVAAASNCRT